MKKITSIIKNGGVAVIKTDTLYGIVGLAKDQSVVDRIYSIKKRDLLKPVVVLISGISDITYFGIEINKKIQDQLKNYWPGKVSVLLNVSDSLNLHYVHKGTHCIAFRIPDNNRLIELLKETGPLVAPSANPEGKKPAKNIKEAMSYFGDTVDFYEDGGECINDQASKIIRITESFDIEIVRE